MSNFIGILHTICEKKNIAFPTYVEKESEGPVKRYVCELLCWTTVGVGKSDIEAKQNAALLMLENPLSNSWSRIKSSVSLATKLNMFADKNRKEKPLYSDKEKEDGLFVVEYKFDGYIAKGKGRSKNIAKKMALDKIAARFNIHRFYENHLKQKERVLEIKFFQASKFHNPY